MKKNIYFLMFLFLLVFVASSNSLAQDNRVGTAQLKLTAGLGGTYNSNPYRGADSKITPFPFLAYEGEKFFLRGTKLGYRLVKQDHFVLSLLGSYRGDGYEGGDSSFLNGMADRDGTFEAGLLASLDTSLGRFSASLLSDVLSEHKGHEGSLTLVKRFSLRNLSVSPSASVIWQSGQLTNYYYGVRTTEATMNRLAYKTGSSYLLRLGVMTNYRLGERWSVTGQLAVTRLADEITDSPIVEDDFVTSAFVGFGYQF